MTLDWDRLLYLDFEARSEVSIFKVGTHAYAQHLSTQPLCCAWVLGTGPINLWKMGDPVPTEWFRPDYFFVAHNKDTERLILQHKFNIHHNSDRWLDTATIASQAGLPRALDEICQALGLPPTGDPGPMQQLARPRKPSLDNPDKFWEPHTRPDLFEKLYTYCQIDTERTRQILYALPPYQWLVSDKERKLELLTDKMNTRGVPVDLPGVAKARALVQEHSEKLKQEFMTIKPGVNPKSAVKRAQALGMTSTDKEAIRDELKAIRRLLEVATLTADGRDWLVKKRRAVEIIKTLNTAAVAKLDAFKDRVTSDGRLHGSMVYCGAGRTWRWSSMGVQLHNLIRGLGSGNVDWPAIDTDDRATETAFGALHSGLISDLYDNPTRVVASMMKGFLTGPFYIGDYSQIEPRVEAMLAGQKSLIESFKKKTDPYKALASRIYNIPIEKVNSDQRFMGKQGVLGCGYGLGWRGFVDMLKIIYDVNVTEQEAKRVVMAYREMNPDIKNYWYNLENLVKQGVLEQWQQFHTSPKCPGIGVRCYKKWLVIKLPSTRCLWYHEPELIPGEYGLELHYWGRNVKLGGRWDFVKTYGGKLTENITQATARDIMADGMLRLEEYGFPLLMTVHDEIVCAPPEYDCNGDQLALYERVMKVPPQWMPGIPLDVDVQFTGRYQK
jgi:DNA polymerase